MLTNRVREDQARRLVHCPYCTSRHTTIFSFLYKIKWFCLACKRKFKRR